MLHFFTDAVLRGPTIGSMLMCFAAGLVGSVVFLRKQSLIGESLSHASYPGVILGVIFAGIFAVTDIEEGFVTSFITLGAFATALAGLWTIHQLEHRFKIRIDSALCFVLSAFFGIGITLASHVQFTHTTLYRQSLTYLYGQAATMTDIHILIFGLLALFSTLLIFSMLKEIQAITFNRDFAKSLGIKTHVVDNIIFVLTTLAVVIGIRSVGVILMSAMLIAPAVAARQYTHRLSIMVAMAGLFGLISGFLGVYLSVELTNFLSQHYPGSRLIFPTGPMIVLVASLLCLLSLFFAPERGLFLRIIRMARFRYKCLLENFLKSIWKQPNHEVTFQQLTEAHQISTLYLYFLLFSMQLKGWLKKIAGNGFKLTPKGEKDAAHIVRLHRLWEVYLVSYLGMGAERVHRNAEEIEHILTPALEQELTQLLNNPQLDPHHQQIPKSMGS